MLACLPLGVLLVCLAGLRISAWLAVLLCAAVTVALAVVVWDAPLDKTLMAGSSAYQFGRASYEAGLISRLAGGHRNLTVRVFHIGDDNSQRRRRCASGWRCRRRSAHRG